MKYSDIVNEINEIGIPSVYHHWEAGNAPKTPYIIHYIIDNQDIGADNINFAKHKKIAIELYSKIPDFINEAKIETMLESLGFFYTTDTTLYIETEKMYLKRYEFTNRKGDNHV